jgi:hypothetical protein
MIVWFLCRSLHIEGASSCDLARLLGFAAAPRVPYSNGITDFNEKTDVNHLQVIYKNIVIDTRCEN